MSVTFSTNPSIEVVGVKINCWNFEEISQPYNLNNYAEVAKTHNDNCEECRVYGGSLAEFEKVVNDMNISNTNASYLLDKLGIEELFGSMSSEDFLGRILIAEALSPSDEGIPSYKDGNIVYGGREENYLQNKLARLREMANYAKNNNLEITWG